MKSRLAVGMAVAALAGAVVAGAQEPGVLRGLSEASVNVSHNWTEADARCGIREADVKAIVAKTAGDSGLKVVDNSDLAELLVSFVTLETEGECISHARVALRGMATATLLFDPRKEPKGLQVVLREESTLLLSPASQHGERFRDRLRGLVERIAAAVKAGNQ